MEKIKMKIVSIVEEPKANGGKHLRIKAESKGKIYTFGVSKDRYLEKHIRERFHQSWIETISKAEKISQKSEKTIKHEEEEIKALVGTEVEESEY